MTFSKYRYAGSVRPGWGPELFASFMQKRYHALLDQNLPERLVRIVLRLADREAREREASRAAAAA